MNHGQAVWTQIGIWIDKRLLTISSNETIFNEAVPIYQEALIKSGYTYKLKFDETQNNNSERTNKRSRKRNITWFNPPYSDNVSTNIGRNFLTLLEKCFPPGHQLHSLLNRNTVKLSYSCMPNMQQLISSHNRNLLDKAEQVNQQQQQSNCNCRKDKICPMEGNCLSESIIYQATVTREDNNIEQNYIGLTENKFKTRYNAHTCSFRNESKRNETTLSHYIWSLKDKNIQHSITWKVITKCKSYSPGSNRCPLCLSEKYYIIYKQNMASLNSRNELASSCRHKKKFLLSNP
jgi:hypothetical protein